MKYRLWVSLRGHTEQAEGLFCFCCSPGIVLSSESCVTQFASLSLFFTDIIDHSQSQQIQQLLNEWKVYFDY